MKHCKLNNWSVRFSEWSPYQAPEDVKSSLAGEVYGHPNFPDGSLVYTTSIVSAQGRTVCTKNTCYTLGEPSESYVRWCRENGITINLDSPIKPAW